mgnify:CR=1 FL=1
MTDIQWIHSVWLFIIFREKCHRKCLGANNGVIGLEIDQRVLATATGNIRLEIENGSWAWAVAMVLVEAVAMVVALGVELVLAIDVALVLAARRRGRWCGCWC